MYLPGIRSRQPAQKPKSVAQMLDEALARSRAEVATDDRYRVALLASLTSTPSADRHQLVLSWMQVYPARWDRYHPERVVEVTSYLNALERD